MSKTVLPDHITIASSGEPSKLASNATASLTETPDEQDLAIHAARMDPHKCVILVPVGQHIEPECEESLRRLEDRGYTVNRVRGYAAIDQARNQMATDALAMGYEETMWIDADIAFQVQDIERLRFHDEPIVCGIYPKKKLRELAIHTIPGTRNILFGNGGGLFEIRYAAAGFLLVRKSVYTSMVEKLQLPTCNLRFGRGQIPFFMPQVIQDESGPWYLAEDYSFCERARQCGFTILADTTIRLWHIGSYGFTWEDAGSEKKRYGRYDFHLP